MGVFSLIDNNGDGVRLAVTDSSGRTSLGIEGDYVRIANLGTTDCYVKFGDDTVTADNTCLHVPGNDVSYPVVLKRDSYKMEYIAAICDSSESTTLQVLVGEWVL